MRDEDDGGEEEEECRVVLFNFISTMMALYLEGFVVCKMIFASTLFKSDGWLSSSSSCSSSTGMAFPPSSHHHFSIRGVKKITVAAGLERGTGNKFNE